MCRLSRLQQAALHSSLQMFAPAALGNNNSLSIKIATACIHEAENSRIHVCVGTHGSLLKLFPSVCPSHRVAPLSALWFLWAFVVFVVCVITEGQEVVLRQAM